MIIGDFSGTILSTFSKKVTFWEIKYTVVPGEEGGGILWISSDRDDWMGTKIKTEQFPTASNKPPKIPVPKFNTQKIPCQISEPWKFPESIKWYYMKHRNISFEHPKKSLLKSMYPKKILSKIFLTKKIQKSQIWFDHPCHLKAGVPPSPGNIVPHNFQWIWAMQNKLTS